MLIVYIFMQESTVIGESCEIPKHVTAVLALVDLVPPVSLYVRPEVVPSSIPSPADVTSKWFLPCVDPHVPTKVSGPDEFSTAHLTRIGALGLWDCSAVTILLRWLIDDANGSISGHGSGCELVNGHDGCLQQGEVPTDVL